MDFTGERAMPAKEGYVRQLYLEHVSRYSFAARLLQPGMTVVDAACGVGYGSSILAAQGCRVIAIDIDSETCGEAAKAARDQSCVVVNGDCCKLPIADNSADVFVSFETIEHVADHGALLQGVRRVLKQAGRLVVSTPNVLPGRERSGNPFHVREYRLDEFRALLHEHFEHVEMEGQVVNPEMVGLLQLERRVQELETVVQKQERLLWRLGVPTRVREMLRSRLGREFRDAVPAGLQPLAEGPSLLAQAALCAPIGVTPPALSQYLIAVCS
jgi:SAM-dependent methyltransferase